MLLSIEQWSVFVIAISAAAQWITNAQTDKVQYKKGKQKNSDNQIQQQKDKHPETTWKIKKERLFSFCPELKISILFAIVLQFF